MLLRAAGEMGLDLSGSWMVGDMISDVLAGINAGCRGSILVRTGKGLSAEEAGLETNYQTADDLPAAADLILASTPDQANESEARTGRARATESLSESSR
jgi:D-glycero-D-manno-heptose 1,7-bisphosphate phosphatase